MKELENFTLKQVTDYLIDQIVKEREISKALDGIEQMFYNL